MHAGARRDETVERHRHLQRDERQRRCDRIGEALDQREAGCIVDDVDDDARAAHPRHAPSVRAHVRVERTDDDAADSGVHDRDAARWHRRLVIVRLERDVHRRTAHVFTGFARGPQRLRFGVRRTFAMVPALAEGAAVARDHRADRRVRRRIPERARGQLDRAGKIGCVGPVYGVTSTPFQNAM